MKQLNLTSIGEDREIYPLCHINTKGGTNYGIKVHENQAGSRANDYISIVGESVDWLCPL